MRVAIVVDAPVFNEHGVIASKTLLVGDDLGDELAAVAEANVDGCTADVGDQFEAGQVVIDAGALYNDGQALLGVCLRRLMMCVFSRLNFGVTDWHLWSATFRGSGQKKMIKRS